MPTDPTQDPTDEKRRVLPTPIRRSLGVQSPDPDTPERIIEIDGRSWVVKTAGRSAGGRTLTNVNLVELEFAPEDGEGDILYGTVVVRGPEVLSDLQLTEVLAKASPASE